MKLRQYLNEASIKDVYKGEHTVPLKDIWSVSSINSGTAISVETKSGKTFIFKKEDQKFIKWYMDRVDILMKYHKGAKK